MSSFCAAAIPLSKATAIVVVESIDSFAAALRAVESVLSNPAGIPRDLQNSIDRSLGTCARILRHIQKNTDSYSMVVASGNLTFGNVLLLCKVAFAWTVMGGKSRVNSLKHRLMDELGTLQALLSAATW